MMVSLFWSGNSLNVTSTSDIHIRAIQDTCMNAHPLFNIPIQVEDGDTFFWYRCHIVAGGPGVATFDSSDFFLTRSSSCSAYKRNFNRFSSASRIDQLGSFGTLRYIDVTT